MSDDMKHTHEYKDGKCEVCRKWEMYALVEIVRECTLSLQQTIVWSGNAPKLKFYNTLRGQIKAKHTQ